MKILILSRNATLYSTSRIVLSARARGHHVTVIDPLDFQIVVTRGKPSLFVGGSKAARFDVVVPRIGASITGYGLAVVLQFELMGVPVLNSAVSIARSRDKLRALQLLSEARIDVPTTVCARNPAGLQRALELVRGCPAIVKLQQGTQGIGTMIADTSQSAHALLETFWAMGQDIVLQEYVKESKGRDVRAIVVGGTVIAAMRRVAKRGEFRANLHRGARGSGVRLPRSYEAAAIRAAALMGLEVAGVDMLEGKRGPRLLEINSSPGLEGIERASGTDVAAAIVAHAEKFVRSHASAKRSRDRRGHPTTDAARARRTDG
ncbi:MAG: RimK family alpha-L-glutamate ligase [Polyangiaceae bacterium]|nr:RimK family alpha-L-glutamate ligase [Polyangiaceae bacterium]